MKSKILILISLITSLNFNANNIDYKLSENIIETYVGDTFYSKKIEFLGGEDIYFNISVDCLEAFVYYCDSSTQLWHEMEAIGEMPIETLYLKTDNSEFIIDPAFIYEPVETASLLKKDEFVRPIFIESTQSGINIVISYPNIAGFEGHHYYLESYFELLPLDDLTKNEWSTHLNNSKQRFCFDGYYYETPSTYYPTGYDMIWRNPASYTPSKYINSSTTRASQSLGHAMLDIVSNNMEENGTFITYPKSIDFLYDNYGIEAGFYDTRFNIEITKSLLNLYQQTNNEKYLDIVIKCLDFFIYHANNNNYTFEKDDKVGILVEDYYHISENYSKTHASLNHILAEINLLYLAYEILNDDIYLNLAEKILLGIEFTRDLWIKDDNSLEYAYLPDGSMGFVDYPYLTYNDLIFLQKTISNLGFDENDTLNYLIYHKKIHMDTVGITGYYTDL